MKRSWRWTLPLVVLGLAIGLALTVGEGDAQQKNVLVAQKVAAAPLYGAREAARLGP